MTFNEYVENVKTKLLQNGFLIYEENSINYGVQLKTAPENALKKHIASVNCYYSVKKASSYSLVLGIKADNPCKQQLESLFSINQSLLLNQLPVNKDQSEKPVLEETKPFADLNIYAGSDEAGKGDYFGPLVVCTFAAHKIQFKELKHLGVKDSKLLLPDEIGSIANQLIEQYEGQYRVELLYPEIYNQRYAEFNNLNYLLADTHFRNIQALEKKIVFEGVIIDQFASPASLTQIRNRYQLKNLHFMTKAESDLCVAAASIIARWYFVGYIKKMSAMYGFQFPKGAGNHVKHAVSLFRSKFGIQELTKVAKMHFKL